MIKDITFQHIRSMVSVLGRHVVGVIDSLQEGEQAAQALEDVGYKAEDIALIPSQDFPSAFLESLQKGGLFLRVMRRLQATTDDGFTGELYLAAARRGHQIITVYVPQYEQIDGVSALLFNHHACLIKYIGNWSIADLYPPIQDNKR